LPLVALAACSAAFAAADGWDAIAGPFAVAYVSAGLALPLSRDGHLGRDHSFRALDSVLVTFAITEGLKHSVRERRPDGSDMESFPSAHASVAFAVATMETQFHPKEAVYWYAGATLIGVARIQEKKHFFHDVLAGSALGYGVARVELSLKHGFVVQPWIGQNGSPGLMFSGRF
jgi:membrane-associated phospholipid phosphatase